MPVLMYTWHEMTDVRDGLEYSSVGVDLRFEPPALELTVYADTKAEDIQTLIGLLSDLAQLKEGK